jgi:hypothetical protein
MLLHHHLAAGTFLRRHLTLLAMPRLGLPGGSALVLVLRCGVLRLGGCRSGDAGQDQDGTCDEDHPQFLSGFVGAVAAVVKQVHQGAEQQDAVGQPLQRMRLVPGQQPGERGGKPGERE